jgi:hypothetical protein
MTSTPKGALPTPSLPPASATPGAQNASPAPLLNATSMTLRAPLMPALSPARATENGSRACLLGAS